MTDHQNLCVTPSNVEGSGNIVHNIDEIPPLRSGLQSARRIMDPRVKHEDLSKFNRHSDLIRMPTTTLGFTLVELAIALMVIGLLIGGVLKGQELIDNARITRTIKDLTDYDTAVMLFRNSYGGLPGDIKNPARIPNCSDPVCNNNTSYSKGNFLIIGHAKSANFWRHLHRAGLIYNINEETDNPDNFNTISPLNGFGANTVMYNVQRDASDPSDYRTNRFIPMSHTTTGGQDSLTVRQAAALDRKLDDGKPLSGTAQTQTSASTHITGNNCYDTTTLEYLVNTVNLTCTLGITSAATNP